MNPKLVGLGLKLMLEISVADPWHFCTDPDVPRSVPLVPPVTDPGGLKTYGSYWSGSRTLVHLHHFSKKNRPKEEIKGFLTIFAWWLKDPKPDPDPYFGRQRIDPCLFFNLLTVAERCGDPGTAGLPLLARHALPDDSRLLRHERGAAHRLGRPAGRVGNKKPTQKNPPKKTD